MNLLPQVIEPRICGQGEKCLGPPDPLQGRLRGRWSSSAASPPHRRASPPPSWPPPAPAAVGLEPQQQPLSIPCLLPHLFPHGFWCFFLPAVDLFDEPSPFLELRPDTRSEALGARSGHPASLLSLRAPLLIWCGCAMWRPEGGLRAGQFEAQCSNSLRRIPTRAGGCSSPRAVGHQIGGSSTRSIPGRQNVVLSCSSPSPPVRALLVDGRDCSALVAAPWCRLCSGFRVAASRLLLVVLGDSPLSVLHSVANSGLVVQRKCCARRVGRFSTSAQPP